MNGAKILCETLLANDVKVCFANPGTSEMHFVAALDEYAAMRCVLGLSEGVVTGAADGYGRMADKPAATLLHLGPGLANGLANLHNARRARTPIVNIVGDHAEHHLIHDAPLASDIESLARPMSDWVGRAVRGKVADLAGTACRMAAATPGISTLILPADAAWEECPSVATATAAAAPQRPVLPDESRQAEAARAAMAGGRCALILGGMALRGRALEKAAAIAERTGMTLLAETASARTERGMGRFHVPRIPYPVDLALECLREFESAILVGAKTPVAFFAYPGKPSVLTRPDCRIVELADHRHDVEAALAQLAERVGAVEHPAGRAASASPAIPQPSSGNLTPAAIAAIVAAGLPDGAVVCDETITSGADFFELSQNSAPHDHLSLTGGAIGIGIPLAAGAAIACPGRKVVGLQADGSGLYTVQGLWTQARERLDVLTVIYANRAYRVLEGELKNVGVVHAGPNARRMLELRDPSPDWVSLARGMGVEAVRVETVGDFRRVFDAALRRQGPFLIEAVI